MTCSPSEGVLRRGVDETLIPKAWSDSLGVTVCKYNWCHFHLTNRQSSTLNVHFRKKWMDTMVTICQVHKLGIEPATPILLKRWPAPCNTRNMLPFITSQFSFLRWDVLGLFVSLSFICDLWWIFNLSWMSVLAQTLAFKSLLCLTSLSVSLHSWQPLLQRSSVLLCFGLVAAI